MRIQGFSFIFTAILCGFASSSSPVHAADPNGYTAQYECRAGNPNCDVDVAALAQQECQQTINPSDNDWSKITNNPLQRVFCLAPGDHRSKGRLTLDFSGTAGARKVLRYSEPDGADPWAQSEGERAVLQQIKFEGSDYWLLHRLTVDGGGANQDGVFLGAGSDNNILSRLLVQRYNGSLIGTDWLGETTGNVIQNSVVRSGIPDDVFEANCFSLEKSANMRIVNNEAYDCHKVLGVGGGVENTRGILVENNDFYISPAFYTGCNGNYNGIGPCSGSEALMSTKAAGVAGSPAVYIHNRLWGARNGDGNLVGWDSCCHGYSISISANELATASYMLFKDNIITDGQLGIGGWWGPDRYVSVIGNIIYGIHAFETGPDRGTAALQINSKQNSEFYLNTIISADKWLELSGGDGSGGPSIEDDIRCNVVLNGGAQETGPEGSTQADYNVFYATNPLTFNASDTNISKSIATRASSVNYSTGTILRTADSANCNSVSNSACFLYKVIQGGTTANGAPSYCTELGCDTTDGGVVVKAIRGPYEFKRKLRTVPGGETTVIPYARIASAADEAGFCPGAGQANRLGARTGIGLTDDVGWNGLLSKDLNGTQRTGAAGALETGAGSPPPPPPPPPPPGRHPFPGPDASAIPGKIEAENYDTFDSTDPSYSDSSPTNEGGAYRMDAVDISVTNDATGGYDVGWVTPGEWLEYTVNVATTGTYTLAVRYVSAGFGGTMHVAFDGTDATGSIVLADTGGWNIYQTVTRSDVALTAGQHRMRVAFDTAGSDGYLAGINFIELTLGDLPPPPPPPAGGSGLTGEYYDDPYLTDNRVIRTDPTVNFNWDTGSPDASIGPEQFSVRWVGQVQPRYSETYTFSTVSNDGAWLMVNGQVVVDAWFDQVATEHSGSITLQAGQKYDITLEYYENTGSAQIQLYWSSPSQAKEIIPASQLFPLSNPAAGNISRQYWLGIGGETISALTSDPNYPNNPSGGDVLTSLEGPTDWADNYGSRIRGYVHPPMSGSYTLWVAGDDNTELYLSSDEDPANKQRIAFVPGWTEPRQWDKYPSQQSAPVALQAGRRYYVEVLHKEGGGGDNVAVSWQLPSGATEAPIPGYRLSPVP